MLRHKLIISAPTDKGQRWAFSYVELRLFGHRFFLSEKLAEIKAPEGSADNGFIERVKVTYFDGGSVYINVSANSLEAIAGEVINLIRGLPVVGLIHNPTDAQKIWHTLSEGRRENGKRVADKKRSM